jgi:MFS family permease
MAPRGVRGIPPLVWLLGLASFLNDVSSEALFPLLPLFLSTLPGGSPAVLGLVEGAADAAASALKVVAGRLSDRGPRRTLVVGGYALPALARGAIALAALPWHVLAARLADRMGKGIRSGPRDALLADAARPGQTGRAFGLQRSLDHLGAALGPLVASGLLAAGVSIRGTFWIAAALGMAAPALLALRLRDPGAGPPPPHAGPLDPPSPREAPSLSPRFWRFLALAALFALGNSTDAFLLLRAGEVGFSAAAIPLLWFGHHAVKTLAGLPGGALSDRIPRAAVVAAGWGAYALAYGRRRGPAGRARHRLAVAVVWQHHRAGSLRRAGGRGGGAPRGHDRDPGTPPSRRRTVNPSGPGGPPCGALTPAGVGNTSGIPTPRRSGPSGLRREPWQT